MTTAFILRKAEIRICRKEITTTFILKKAEISEAALKPCCRLCKRKPYVTLMQNY